MRRPRTARSRSSTPAGKLVTDIKNGHSDTVFGVAFSPDGKLLATCGADKFVKVFELPTEAGQAGEVHQVVRGPHAPRPGRRLDAGRQDARLVRRGQRRQGVGLREGREDPRHAGPPEAGDALFFVGKTPQFLTGSGDASVRMWNVDNGGNVRNFAGAGDFVYAVGASTDGDGRRDRRRGRHRPRLQRHERHAAEGRAAARRRAEEGRAEERRPSLAGRGVGVSGRSRQASRVTPHPAATPPPSPRRAGA